MKSSYNTIEEIWTKNFSRCKTSYVSQLMEGLEVSFQKDRSRLDGLESKCRKCSNLNSKNQGSRWARLNQPEKYKARSVLNNAIASGKIIKPTSCEFCHKTGTRIHGHHDDYSKPLQVIFLCQTCHKNIHLKLKGRA